MFGRKLYFSVSLVLASFISTSQVFSQPHSHGGRSHNHGLPALGIAHKHGGGPVGAQQQSNQTNHWTHSHPAASNCDESVSHTHKYNQSHHSHGYSCQEQIQVSNNIQTDNDTNENKYTYGTYQFEDGSVYSGTFLNNQFNGKGTFTDSEGNKYVGNFLNGKQHGHGTSYRIDGYKHVGMYSNGLRHGRGTIYFNDKKDTIGIFSEDLLVKMIDANSITKKTSNAVQQAQAPAASNYDPSYRIDPESFKLKPKKSNFEKGLSALSEIAIAALNAKKQGNKYTPSRSYNSSSSSNSNDSYQSIANNTNQPAFVREDLRPWSPITSARKNSKGSPLIRICMRDHECEDGDIIRVDINHGSGHDYKNSITRELTNRNQCSTVSAGAHTYIKITAVNGTGYKGSCGHANVNTGEVSVQGFNNDGSLQSPQVQRWKLRRAAGSSSYIKVF